MLSTVDIMPTLLEIAGAEYPQQYQGRTLATVQGRSILPLLTGATDAVRGEADWLGWELFGNRAIRQGDWKLVYDRQYRRWELYDVKTDRTETVDLSAKHPERVKALHEMFLAYCKRANVLPLGAARKKKRKPKRVTRSSRATPMCWIRGSRLAFGPWALWAGLSRHPNLRSTILQMC